MALSHSYYGQILQQLAGLPRCFPQIPCIIYLNNKELYELFRHTMEGEYENNNKH